MPLTSAPFVCSAAVEGERRERGGREESGEGERRGREESDKWEGTGGNGGECDGREGIVQNDVNLRSECEKINANSTT